MNSDLASSIGEATKAAMRARDKIRLDTLRLLQAAIKQKAVDERKQPDDTEIMRIIEKQARQRRESIAAFESGGRTEQAARERAELAILQEFLPRQADAAEIDAAIAQALAEVDKPLTGAAMGAVMARLKASLAGRADMSAIAAKVRAQMKTAG